MAEETKTQPSEVTVRAFVHRYLAENGARATARFLGMSRDAALALAAGAHVHPGTLALARERIGALGIENSTPEISCGPVLTRPSR